MRFRAWGGVHFLTVGFGLWTVAFTGAIAADDPIAVLNRAIQARFADVDTQFGLRRIVTIGDTPHRFRPENVGELDAVQALESARLRLALYLAGRRVLDREPELAGKTPFVLDRRVLFGPIAVTRHDLGSELPQAIDLLDESRLAFRTLTRRDRYDFAMGAWQFTARPVRATTACLRCHQGRLEGEPLGVVLYAVKKE